MLLISMGAPGNSMETDFTISRSTVPCRRNSHCSSKYTTPRARWCQGYVLAKMLPFALYGIWVYIYYATLRQFGVDVFVLCDSTLGSNMKSNGSVDPGRIGNSSIVLCYQKVPYLGIFGLFLLAVYRTFCYMSSFGGIYYVDISLFCYHNLC